MTVACASTEWARRKRYEGGQERGGEEEKMKTIIQTIRDVTEWDYFPAEGWEMVSQWGEITSMTTSSVGDVSYTARRQLQGCQKGFYSSAYGKQNPMTYTFGIDRDCLW